MQLGAALGLFVFSFRKHERTSKDPLPWKTVHECSGKIEYTLFFTVYSHVFFHLAGFFICYASSITEECHGTLQNQHVRAHLHNIHNLSEQLKSQIML